MEKNTYIKNGFVSENIFRTGSPLSVKLPSYNDITEDLPKPLWGGHEDVIEMYWKAWEIGMSHLKNPTSANGFISSFLDTAYNGNIFMWDSVFITLFARYGLKAFPFQKTLDNFYRKQHLDGFICREIYGHNGEDAFQRHDPASTGPNLMAWSEWEYYKATGDLERLNNVYPVLCAYHLWLKEYRTWKDGSYWTSGWGSGMDNIPRIPAERHPNFSHGHMTWLDATLQQYMNGSILLQMGFELERWQEIEEIEDELHVLKKFISQHLWDDEKGFLFDLYSDGSRSACKHIGAFWVLHTDILDDSQKKRLISSLQKGGDFRAERMVSSTSPGHPRFRENGRYWQGGIWAPTNYMILSGLRKNGYTELAREIALKHLNHVNAVFKDTGTFWEYYSPSGDEPGFMARAEFIGWTGLVPVADLFEFAMGITAEYDKRKLSWDVGLKQAHGVANYPFGPSNTVGLKAESWSEKSDTLSLEIEAAEDFSLSISWMGKESSFNVIKGMNRLSLKK